MNTTIFLLVLAFAILGKPFGWLKMGLESIDWKDLAIKSWDKVITYSKKAGRSSSRPLLHFYYVMTEDALSTKEKALVYAAIIYMAVPRDMLPVSVFGWLGLIDDVCVTAYVYSKIKRDITPEIEMKTEQTLNAWFGPEIVTEHVITFNMDQYR